VRRHRDIFAAVALLGVAVAYFGGACHLPAGRGEPGAAFFPLILSSALTLTALFILARGLGAAAVLQGADQAAAPGGWWKPGAAILLTVAYVASFSTIGFVLGTWLYTLFVTLLFRRDRPIAVMATPILCTLLIYLLFQVALGVELPRGLLGGLIGEPLAEVGEQLTRSWPPAVLSE
jgi:putative tricarboxylic transport membrane protein